MKKSAAAIAPEVGLDERRPRVVLAPRRGRPYALLLKDSLDRIAADLVAHVPQCPAQPGVPPAWILLGHSHEKSHEFRWLPRPSGTPLLAPVVLRGDQLPVPPQDRVGRRNPRDLTQRPSTELFTKSAQAAALRIGQTDPAPELLQEHAVLFL